MGSYQHIYDIAMEYELHFQNYLTACDNFPHNTQQNKTTDRASGYSNVTKYLIFPAVNYCPTSRICSISVLVKVMFNLPQAHTLLVEVYQLK